ncbi:MAG: hypothetical protein GXO79_11435 [Chlorobi bacterium]|nr:hypothetical protein [Chlorobiota bacterium]
MAKRKNQLRIDKKNKEEIRVVLNRDLNYKFFYFQPIDSKYAYFEFKDMQTKNKAYRDLMFWYSGKSLAKFRGMIKK